MGTVTTKGYYGTFSLAWTPSDAGIYQIIATFEADESYGSSAASTTVFVGQAPEKSPEPAQPLVPPDNSALLYGIIAVVIISIILSIYAVLRKRP